MEPHLTCYVLRADYLTEKVPGSKLIGFKGGPAGIMKGKYVEITKEFMYPYRNQVRWKGSNQESLQNVMLWESLSQP